MPDDEYMCDQCGRQRATWHLTEFAGGQPVRQHLCEDCYSKKEGVPKPDEAVARLIAALVPELKDMAMRACPACNINYLEFRQHMRLGCPNDYVVFEKPLEQLLQQVHGASSHNGKAPVTAGREETMRSRLRTMRRRQQEAIAQENYELAGKLRDQIRELEKNGPDTPKG